MIAVVHVHVLEGIERRRRRAIDVGAHVDDRGGGEPAIAGVDAAGRIGAAHRDRIADHALRHDLAVAVVAAGFGVDLDKLREADLAVIERVEAILHAHIVVSGTRKSGFGILAERVDDAIPEAAAGSARIGFGVVPKIDRHHRTEAVEWGLPGSREAVPATACSVGSRCVHWVPIDLCSPARRPLYWIRHRIEVAVEQAAIDHVRKD